jgi:hypothetical protein
MGAAHAPYFWAFVAASIVVAVHVDEAGPLEFRAVESTVPVEQPVRL